MDNIRLQELYYRPEYKGIIQMGLLRYVNYQMSADYVSMTEEYKVKFMTLESLVFGNLDVITEKLSKIIIGDSAILALNCYHEFTDAIAQPVLEYIIQNQIDKLIT